MMKSMKKFIVFLVCAVLLIAAARVITLRYQDRPEDFAEVQEWIEIGKEKVEEITDNFSGQISGQDWEIEGSYDIDTEDWFDNEGEIYSGNLAYTRLSAGEVKSLVLQAAGCKVVIRPTEESDFYFEFENMKKVQAYQEESRLVIKVVRDTLIEKETESNILTLYVPTGCILDCAELELGAGSMQIDTLQANELDLSVEAGKLTVMSLRAQDVTTTLGAGVITLDNVNLQNVSISVGVGSMTVNGQISGNVEADCAMGGLQMSLQGTVKDFNYELQCVAGNILLDGEKHSGLNEGKLIDNAAQKSMELDCAMGSMKIEFEE